MEQNPAKSLIEVEELVAKNVGFNVLAVQEEGQHLHAAIVFSDGENVKFGPGAAEILLTVWRTLVATQAELMLTQQELRGTQHCLEVVANTDPVQLATVN